MVTDYAYTADLETLTPEQAAENIIKFASEGRLVQNDWQTVDEDGRQVACLLGSIHGGINSPSKCPGKIMPTWVAEITPSNFDELSEDEVEEIGLKYADYLIRWSELTEAQWTQARELFTFLVFKDGMLGYRAAGVGRENEAELLRRFEADLRKEGGLTTFERLLYAAAFDQDGNTAFDFDYDHVSWLIEALNDELDNSYFDDNGRRVFDALFEALDVVLPREEVRDYTFDVTTERKVYETTRVIASGAGMVYARRNAMKAVPGAISAMLVETVNLKK